MIKCYLLGKIEMAEKHWQEIGDVAGTAGEGFIKGDYCGSVDIPNVGMNSYKAGSWDHYLPDLLDPWCRHWLVTVVPGCLWGTLTKNHCAPWTMRNFSYKATNPSLTAPCGHQFLDKGSELRLMHGRRRTFICITCKMIMELSQSSSFSWKKPPRDNGTQFNKHLLIVDSPPEQQYGMQNVEKVVGEAETDCDRVCPEPALTHWSRGRRGPMADLQKVLHGRRVPSCPIIHCPGQ